MGVRKGLIAGVVILLVVDAIWVGSSGISRHLFHNEHYNKPLFWTYFKTTLFSLYLSAFLFWRPWQRLCWEGYRQGRWAGFGGRRVWLRVLGDRRAAGTVMDKSYDHQVTESQSRAAPQEVESTSCGIDETTGQCTQSSPLSLPGSQQSFTAPQTRKCLKRQEFEELDITCAKKGDDGDREMDTNWCRSHEVVREGGREGEGEGLIPCLATVKESSSRSRHTNVVDGRVFFKAPNSVNSDTCPINPPLPTCKLDPCLVGPPEFRPLNCTLSEEDRKETGPLSPCSSKYCKVRFNRTIEVREAKSAGSQRQSLLSVRRVASLALVFGIVWFFANYLYALALVSKSVALVNTLSSMSSVFVMIMAALPLLHSTPSDRITLSRILVTLLSVAGAALVSISDSTATDHAYWSPGALIALASAVLYALYLVLLKKLVQHPESLELPMFFGFVGLFDTVLLFPLLLIWHYTGLEGFEWPPSSDIWTLLLVNGFVGTVISELLWLWGVFLTSPLVGTLSLALVTPLSIAYSIFIGKQPFSLEFFVGAVVIVVCFVLVTVLDHFGSWDPLWALIKTTATAARNYRAHRGYSSLSDESKRLIEHEDDSTVDQLSF